MAKKQTHSGSVVKVGVGVAAAAAVAAAGAYWFYGSDHASKHRKEVKSWMLKARAEMMEAVEKISDIDKKKYMEIVQQILARYSKMPGVTAAETAHMKKDLATTWMHIEAARTSGVSAIKGVRKSVQKAKKTVKKMRAAAKKTK